jgi:hypothetical protein
MFSIFGENIGVLTERFYKCLEFLDYSPVTVIKQQNIASVKSE